MRLRAAALLSLLSITLAGAVPAAPARPASRARDTAPVVRSSATPEFSGYIRLHGVFEASLRDPATGRSLWVKLRDERAPYYIETFDERSRTLVVRLAVGVARIALRDESAGAAPAPEIHVRADGKIWTDPKPGEARHPDDPGNAD